MMAPRRAVYTALMGGYEELLDQEAARGSEIPFICFTDDPGLRSETWEVRLVEPAFPMDAIRSARSLKQGGHPSLAEFDETLWIDNTVVLKTDPAVVLDEWLAAADIAMPLHSYRQSVAAEFQEVLVQGLDEHARLYEQLAHYSATHPETLEQVPFWTALVARRSTPAVRAFGERWRDHVLRYSRRDQLSVRTVAAMSGIGIAEIDLPNRESPVHRWPAATGRRSRRAVFRTSEHLQPAVARLGEMQRKYDDTVTRLTAAVADRERRVVELEAERAAILGSRSWRLARRLGGVAARLRGSRR